MCESMNHNQGVLGPQSAWAWAMASLYLSYSGPRVAARITVHWHAGSMSSAFVSHADNSSFGAIEKRRGYKPEAQYQVSITKAIRRAEA